jgi:hypothetical protein
MSETSLKIPPRLGLAWSRFRRRQRQASPVSFFEFWPGWLFYLPVVLFWIINGVKYRSLTLPALANPRIDAGGICGESKNDILQLAGPFARQWIADFAGMTTAGHVDGNDLAVAEAAMAEAGIRYPVVAKPDMSCNGVGVRIVENANALQDYLVRFPRATRLQLQTLVDYEGEAGIFYIRRPGEATGRITSVTLKFAPTVAGDGRRSIRELIALNPRLNAVSRLLLKKLGAKADAVPAPGKSVRLVFVGNHCRGSTFQDGLSIVTPALTARVDAIARDIPDLFFSRIDLRYKTLDELQAGENFKIIEINGSGSEATHIWDPSMTLRRAYATQFFHYGESFKIGAAIRAARGLRPTSPLRLLTLWIQQKRLMAAYPPND